MIHATQATRKYSGIDLLVKLELLDIEGAIVTASIGKEDPVTSLSHIFPHSPLDESVKDGVSSALAEAGYEHWFDIVKIRNTPRTILHLSWANAQPTDVIIEGQRFSEERIEDANLAVCVSLGHPTCPTCHELLDESMCPKCSATQEVQ